MPEQQPEGVPDLDSLDMFFTLPETVDDPNLRHGYEVLVARLRRESSHVPMNTVQELLLERIAHNYIVLKLRESQPIGSPGGFMNSSSQKDYNTFWLDMTREFNKQVRAVPKGERDALVSTIAAVFNRVLRTSGLDKTVSEKLRNQLAAELEEAGL